MVVSVKVSPQQEDVDVVGGDKATAAEKLEYSWTFSMKKLENDIKDVESRKLGLLDIMRYEFEVVKYSILPMICCFGALAALCLPLYEYAKVAIEELKETGYPEDYAKQITELQICPGTADPDTCQDPRFVMAYGVQEQFGQVYEAELPLIVPYLPLTMFVVPAVFVFSIYFALSTSAGPLAVDADGKQTSYTDVWATSRLIRCVMLVGGIVFTAAQTLKSIGKISSRLGSLVSIAASAACLFFAFRKIVYRGNGDPSIIKGYIATSIGSGLFAIIVNQYIMKRITGSRAELQLCLLWLVWNVLGELTMGYWRLCVRKLDLTKCDTHVVCMLSIQAGSVINTMKRIPLLCLTNYSYIVVMNVVSFFLEVMNRITVVARDKAFDRCVRRIKDEDMAWTKSSLHRQVYIHNEMLQEIFELIYPVPLAIVLYLIQFNPVGVPVELGPIATNCILQMVQEFFADGFAIWYGSTYQDKFYRVAAANMWSPYRFKLMVFLISCSTFASNGFFLYTYLRVGETMDGKYITLI